MPLFGKKKRDSESRLSQKIIDPDSVEEPKEAAPRQMRRAKLSFQCQLAHGSPTGFISDFKNIKELYLKIAECFEIPEDDILFCTLNTHKIDMDNLLGSQIGLDDFIFAHIKGQKKEIDICKSDDSLGMTITDNGAGRAFVKRIRNASQVSNLPQGLIDIGDHIEKIDNEGFLGKRHYDVARKLRAIEVGKTFTIRLISPEKSVYSNIKSRSEFSSKTPLNIVSGKKTLRLTDGGVYEEMPISNMEELAVEAINRHVEKALGIADNEMAQLILNMGMESQNPLEFNSKMNEDLGEFLFPDLLLQDFWGVITDAKKGLLKNGSRSPNTLSTALSTPKSMSYTNVIYEDKL